MKSFSGELTDYVTNHIEPLLPKFSRAFVDNFTLEYNVSSLAESTNSLFKRNLRACNYTLKDIRIELIEAIQKYYDFNSRKNPCILRDVYGIDVSEKVKTLLLNSLLKSFRLTYHGGIMYIPGSMVNSFNCYDAEGNVDKDIKYSFR